MKPFKFYVAFLNRESRKDWKKVAASISSFIYGRCHCAMNSYHLLKYGEFMEFEIKNGSEEFELLPWDTVDELIEELDVFFAKDAFLVFDEETYKQIVKKLDIFREKISPKEVDLGIKVPPTDGLDES